MKLSRLKTTLIDDAFQLTVLFKGIGGIVEFASGLIILATSVATLQAVLEPLTHLGINVAGEITANTKLFAVFYFCSRGLIRALLAAALLKEQLWAYPVTIVLLVGTVIYQIILMTTGHYSVGLLALTLFDLLVIGLTQFEYAKLKQGGHLSRPGVWGARPKN